jgi:hypothetical protein
MSDHDGLPQISVSLLTAAALSKRSSLYVWMLVNHDTFADVLKKAGRPNWEALARTLGNEGLKNAEGNLPSEETTRQTWWKVRKAVLARRGRRHASQQPTASAAPVPAQQAPQRPVAIPPQDHTDLDPAPVDEAPTIVLKNVTKQQ